MNNQRADRSRVFDCFTYFNEVEALTIRLRHLHAVVDRFIIVQATTTHSGHRNDHRLTLDSPILQPFASQVKLFTVHDLPAGENRWLAEMTQRNAIIQALEDEDICDDDLVLISDVDEIPNSSTVERLQIPPDGVGALNQTLHYYRFDLLLARRWRAARVVHPVVLRTLTPSEIRLMFTTLDIPDGGWHFSYLARRSDAGRKLLEKVQAFAHSEVKVDRGEEFPLRRGAMRFGHLGHLLLPFRHELLPVEARSPEFEEFYEWPRGIRRFERVLIACSTTVWKRWFGARRRVEGFLRMTGR